MLHPSTQQLIRKLCELTDAGHIAWKEGERQSSRFESEGYVVEVEAEPPTLRLLRGDGRELERANAADLVATVWPDGDGTYATHLVTMAEKAHRVARGAEAAIARILSSLSAPPKTDADPEPEAPPAATSAPPSPHTAPPAEPPKPETTGQAEPASTPDASPPAFGAIEGFAQPVESAPPPASPPLLAIRGFSARSVQTPESTSARDLAAAAQPAPKPQEPAPGPSVYKPWT